MADSAPPGERSYGAPVGGPATATMHYLCAECGVKVGINKGEPIRCKECGHRILYKQRTRRLAPFPFPFLPLRDCVADEKKKEWCSLRRGRRRDGETTTTRRDDNVET